MVYREKAVGGGGGGGGGELRLEALQGAKRNSMGSSQKGRWWQVSRFVAAPHAGRFEEKVNIHYNIKGIMDSIREWRN